MTSPSTAIAVRNTTEADIPGIIDLCKAVYPESIPWAEKQLRSHLEVFPQGQIVAVDHQGEVMGMASSLVVLWDDYGMNTSWRDMTDHGMFTNHDAKNGRTLYGAEVMVHPRAQGHGVGSLIYNERRLIAQRHGLLRIRAGARLRNYHLHADHLPPEAYVEQVVKNEIRDATLSFQLHRGFDVLAVVGGYLLHDSESRGYAAVIEWLNPEVATDAHVAGRNPRFLRPR